MIELFLESLRVSLETIRNNKLRSFLTTLGIIIGVMTIIIVVSIIAGLQSKMNETFSSIGSNVIYIQRREWIQRGMSDFRRQQRNYVNISDYRKVKDMAKTAEMVGVNFNRMHPVRYKNEKLDIVTIRGITANVLEMENFSIDVGIPLTDDDILYKRNVCVIGKDIKKNLFGEENPIGKSIIVDGKRFVVQGVLSEKGSVFGQSMDEIVMIPYTVMLRYYPEVRDRVGILVLSNTPKETIEEVRWIMRLSHSLGPDDRDDFAINTQDALINQWQNLTTSIFLVMIAIGSLSLLVGGIGIMNIMLVSVSERTREIGIRKSIGAKNNEIQLQFLFESITVSLVGGIIGIFAGLAIAFLISKVSNLPFAIQIWSILTGFFFSVSVGLFFGIFPAKKAANLDPVECLRYE